MSQRQRVCLIYTGGTIGMVEEGGVLRPPEDPRVFLRIAPELEQMVDLEAVFLLNKDSTNMNPTDWVSIARAIYDRRNDGFSGFVVAHGTDTMHFTASALAFAFGPRLPFPIVLTGAQAHPQVHHGDARVNLLRAFRTAIEPIAEVCITFGDYVFRGCRAQKKDEKRFDAFESPAFPPLAYITETIDIQPLANRRNATTYDDIGFRPTFSPGIFQISLIPGLEPELLWQSARAPQCNGVILQSFGAGNVPDVDAQSFSFEDFIQRTVAEGKPVIITSQFPAGSTLTSNYAPHVSAVRAGAIPTDNMTSSSAAVKFRWVLAQVEQEIATAKIPAPERINRVAEWMEKAYVGELGSTVRAFHEEVE